MTQIATDHVGIQPAARPWKRAPLGELCRTSSGGTPSRKRPDYFCGSIPWVKSGELTDGSVSEVEEFITEDALANSSAKVFPAGTLLIALYGATVGKLGLLTRAAATNQAVCAILPPQELDTHFLFWYLRHRRAELIAQAVGGAQPNISQSILRKLEVPVPPVTQQRRIVAEIEKQFSRLDEAVANLKRVKANLKRYKAAVLKSAVEGRLVPTEDELARREGRDYESGARVLARILDKRRRSWDGRGKYKEPNIVDSKEPLPAGWTWASIGQLLNSLRNGLSRRPADGPPGLPILRISAVRPLQLYLDDCRHYRPEPDEAVLDYAIRENDLLFVRYNGTKELVGACALVSNVQGNVLYPDKLIRGRVVAESFVSPGFLAIAANTGVSRKHIDDLIKTTAGQQGIAGGEIKRVPMPMPPSQEQFRIASEVDRRLSLVREGEADVDRNIARALALRTAVLMLAFCDVALEGQV